MPRILVDIRHESSHNELPSLPLLRVGVDEALVWLDASYWDQQTKHLQSCFDKLVSLLKVQSPLLNSPLNTPEPPRLHDLRLLYLGQKVGLGIKEGSKEMRANERLPAQKFANSVACMPNQANLFKFLET